MRWICLHSLKALQSSISEHPGKFPSDEGVEVMIPANARLFGLVKRASPIHTVFTPVTTTVTIIEISTCHETEAGHGDSGPYARFCQPESVRPRDPVTLPAPYRLRAPYSRQNSGGITSGARARRQRSRAKYSGRLLCILVTSRANVCAISSVLIVQGQLVALRPASRLPSRKWSVRRRSTR
jgi:hypothetical protein